MSRDRRPSLDVHLLAHTHWDREWYQPAPRFRLRLATLVEELLHAGTDAARPFLLDGQAVVLEDVLAVRPDLLAPLRDALQAGALEAGPWYVLADELIPSGEALVRNLLAGRRVLASFGASPPPVCYSPDAFGHPAALPSIAAGFGLSVGVMWRGYGGPRWPTGDTVRWLGSDGSSLLVWHLPPDGYEYGSALPTDPDAARARWARLAVVLEARARTGVVLLTNGADHHARQRGLDDAAAALGAAAEASGSVVRRSSLAGWAAVLAERALATTLPEVRGELRDSYGYTWTLQGTFATRAHQKRAAARVDRLLRHDLEPWLALAQLLPHDAHRHVIDTPSARRTCAMHQAVLDRVWRTYLRVLPHDTICGCSVDAVARALAHRLEVVAQEAAECREATLDLLLGRDPVRARDVPRAHWAPRLVVRNRCARERHGLVHAALVRTLRDVPVGPGSAPSDLNATGSAARDDASVLASPLVPPGLLVQPLRTTRRDARRESPQHYPDNDLVEVTEALVWLPESQAVPGHGLRGLSLVETRVHGERESDADAIAQSNVHTNPHPSAPPHVTVQRDGSAASLDNGRLRVSVSREGVVLDDLATARRIDDLLAITWQADHGDSYTPAPRGPVRRLRLVSARIVARGPLRAAARLTFAARVPRRCAIDERLDASPESRGRVRVVVHVTLTLDAGARHVGLTVRGIDHAGDHRLRLFLATGIHEARVWADAAMWPVQRLPLALSAEEQQGEQVIHAAPLHRWVARDGGAHGTTVIADGLAEYECVDDDRVAVTLVRATGELSRARLPERPGHAGWPARVPAAQGPGPFRAMLAIAPHDAYDAGLLEALADDVLLPLVGHTWRDAPSRDATHGDDALPFITFESAQGVVARAVKPADAGGGVILRCVNLEDAPRTARWRLPWRGVQASLVRLDESTPDDGARVTLARREVEAETHLELTLAPRAIATVRATLTPRPVAR